MKYILREAQEKDINVLHSMYKRLAKEHQELTGIPVMKNIRTMFGTPEDAEPTQYIKDLIDSKKYHIWVLTDDIDILGMIHFAKVKSEIFPNEADMYIYYLVSNLEKHGVATSLLNCVKSAARKTGCKGVSLDVLTNNQNALALYIKCGFQILKTDSVRKRMYCKL